MHINFYIQFDQISVNGTIIQDTVCIAAKTGYCVNGFPFFMVTSVSSNMLPINGAIGLAPDDPSNGPNFISALQ